MAGNPNTGSADTNTGTDTNATSARAGSMTAASVSPVGHSESQQQRSRNDKQKPLHEDLPWLVIMATDPKPQIWFSRIDTPQVLWGAVVDGPATRSASARSSTSTHHVIDPERLVDPHLRRGISMPAALPVDAGGCRCGSWLCKNAKTFDDDRRNYSSETVLAVILANALK
jgi:hypothetical protein